ncbi:NAD(P)-dependent oxidoreductase [Kluyvera genomosp. 2]|uniref:NAD(P)-dependent oxidoreductase n=1 Tax=Kluyvera genomosp. 2 TaxID=2774054 RepID=UPI002FD81C81
MRHIAFIGFGEAGTILASELAHQHRVVVWDCKLRGGDREAMLAKAERAGVQAAGSLAEALDGAAWVFSTVTAGAAREVALHSAALMQAGQYFLDLNSVAPDTKRQASEAFAPGVYVDVAVMAPVPPARMKTPLLVGGPQAQVVTDVLNQLGFNARYGADAVGSVSAIKMCRSVMIKGLEALTTECLFAARAYGVEAEVLASLHASFPSLGWDAAFPGYLISRVAEHGVRRSEEMEEVVKTLRDVGGEGLMSQSTSRVQRGVPQQMQAYGLDYAGLEPFSWQRLADTLKGR